jgi:hypothetical protein
LMSADSAAPELSLHLPEFGTPTHGTGKTIAPAQLDQIIKAGFIRSKTMLELNQRSRIIFFHTKILHIVAG